MAPETVIYLTQERQYFRHIAGADETMGLISVLVQCTPANPVVGRWKSKARRKSGLPFRRPRRVCDGGEMVDQNPGPRVTSLARSGSTFESSQLDEILDKLSLGALKV